MFRSDTRALILSVGDLVHAGRCEYGLLRDVDREFGRIEPFGALQQDSAWLSMLRRGTEYERSRLRHYQDRFGAGRVAHIPQVNERTDAALHEGFERTLAALRSDSRVIYQAVLFGDGLLGYADFLVREDDGRWRVEDTKLTAASGVAAQYQVAAYSTLLAAANVPLAKSATIAFGDGSQLEFPLSDVVPAFEQTRVRVERLVQAHIRSGAPARWEPHRMLACLRCRHCRAAISATRDVLLVDGVGSEEREALRAAGITTVDELAFAERGPAGLASSTFERLRRRSALQLAPGDLPNAPAFEVVHPELLGRLPAADSGDLFLSFAAQGRPEGAEAVLDHCFSVLGVDGTQQTYAGDDRQAEAEAFVRFLGDVRTGRRSSPGMRIYHYSPIDRPHLLDLAGRTGAGRDAVDALIDDGVLVDLFTVVDDALLIGTPDRSLREVGRLADPELAHALSAEDPELQRAEERRLTRQGDPGADQLRSRIERENLERCAMTKRLRDWLLDLMAAEGVQPGSIERPRRRTEPTSEVATALAAASRTGGDSPLHAIAGAALEYHQLEASVFWRAHARRLHRHTDEWAERTRGAARIHTVEVVRDWTEGPRGGMTRILRLGITASPGTTLRIEERPFLVYEELRVPDDEHPLPGARTATRAGVLQADDELLVEERLTAGAAPWTALPAAIAPGSPPDTSEIETAVERWAASLLRGEPSEDAVTDVLLRRAPRLTAPTIERAESIEGRLDAHASLLRTIETLNRSFVAVQGPPGSGKTRIGARTVADLLERGWRIGVVAQSHAVVEHFLEQVVRAGAAPERVGKSTRWPSPRPFTVLADDGERRFMHEHADGFVLGGTAWAFTNQHRVPFDSLDLLVVDEAGQFGLVNLIAAGQSTRNLLLLGDPQQLKQVSQASHRAGADSSALGWLLDGAAILPERFGFFLDRTWRMHPELTRAVSDLSYDGALSAHAQTRHRSLSGIAPGLHFRAVRHLGNTDSSPEEAAEVVRLVRSALDRPWQSNAATPPRAMTERDIIVVAPFNAQVAEISGALREAGLRHVQVGTVDRFQGREAALAIYSTTVAHLGRRPQATDFVLGRNRLNVAISRAQWAAVIVHSTRMADFRPRNANDAAALSRFLNLRRFGIGSAVADHSRPDTPAAS